MQRCLALTLPLLFFPSVVAAGQLRIPLPDLLGSYSISYLPQSSEIFTIQQPSSNSRRIQLTTNLSLNQVDVVYIELRGTIDFGTMHGDGITRQPIERPLEGAFYVNLSVPNLVALSLGPADAGPFEFTHTFRRSALFVPSKDQLVFNGEPVADNIPADMFNPIVDVYLSPDMLRLVQLIPLLNPDPTNPLGSIWGYDGLTVTVPLTGEITSATLVIEGSEIPEPSSAVLLAIALLIGAIARFARVGSYPTS